MTEIQLAVAGVPVFPAVVSVAATATPAIDTDVTDVAEIVGLAVPITSFTTNLSGTPADGQKLLIRVTDNGTTRAVAWGASFKSSGGAVLPTATPTGKRMTVGLVYDSAAASWVCMAVDSAGY